jgi:hypothetical protein
MATNENDRQEHFGAALPLWSAKLKPGHSSHRSTIFNAEIGKKMRAMYDDLLDQPIPDRFIDLLKEIDKAQETPPR